MRLLDEAFVNATLVLVVVTCVAGPILSERSARRIGKEGAPPEDTAGAPAPVGAPS